jgi:hypothetical protein
MLINELFNSNSEPVIEGVLDNPGQEDSPVAQAIIRRILLQRTDLLAKYGPEKVGQSVDEVADFVGDVDEIGSSDVSGWVRHVEQMLGNMTEGSLEEIDRRDFLKGVGAAAVAGAAGGANAGMFGPEFTYDHINRTIAQAFFLYNYTKNWEGKENIAQSILKQINEYVELNPVHKQGVEKTAQMIETAISSNQQTKPELYNTQRTNALKHVSDITNKLQDINDKLRSGKKPTKESVDQGMAEGDISQLEKDVAAAPVEPIANMEAQEKIGGRHDADDFDVMVSRLKKLAGSGPMKTVYDPNTRRYKNVPVAQQPGDKK